MCERADAPNLVNRIIREAHHVTLATSTLGPHRKRRGNPDANSPKKMPVFSPFFGLVSNPGNRGISWLEFSKMPVPAMLMLGL